MAKGECLPVSTTDNTCTPANLNLSTVSLVKSCPLLCLQDDFLSAELTEKYLDYFLNQHHWPTNDYTINGRRFQLPRQQTWHADQGIVYSYTNNLLTSRPWNPILTAIRQKLETLLSVRFNAALVNLYRNGQDYVGWHSDDDKEMGEQPIIASVSLGASREFSYRSTDNSEYKGQVTLSNGSLLVMLPEFQQRYQHAVLAEENGTDARINLTFRFVFPPRNTQ